MELLILGHILGDFYLQTEKMADKKRTNIVTMMLHCVLYGIAMFVALFLQTDEFLLSIQLTLLLAAVHGLVDIIKVRMEKDRIPKWVCIIFLIDQCIHVAALWLVYIRWGNDLVTSLGSSEDTYAVIIAVVGGLICWRPAAIFISLILKMLPEAVEDHDGQEKTIEVVGNADEMVGVGFWIGVLEREIILLLGLLGQYGTIGFVLTAKSVSRYKQLEKKSFAEKYLIGTLSSALIAMACVAVYSWMTNG